jgi:very-short-patch-repair endonuclease
VERRAGSAAGDGQMHVAVIGIDRYRGWPRLHNAVSDARGARDVFVKLGFRHVGEPLLDEAATHAALHRLVTDDLGRLGKDDSLVLFFAGHGHTVTTEYSDGETSRRGYILPSDADPRRPGTWLNLQTWLSEVAHLPPRHILVILDACHSGIALASVIRWRGGVVQLGEPMESLRTRKSRRIITSALGDQRAMDGGPRPGHSLFTGCLIEALTGRLAAETSRPLATGTELGLHLQRRVAEYPSSQQTPDFGTLELDNRGELIVQLLGAAPKPRPPKVPRRTARARTPRRVLAPRRRPDELLEPKPRELDRDPEPGTDDSKLAPAFVAALDRHAAERARGASVLSVIAGDATVARAGWAEWAAGHGLLTLATEGASPGAAIAELLAQIPWLRCVSAARASLAAAAGLDVVAVDASLDARSGRERSAWIDRVAGLDRYAQVSGWLLSALREPRARVPDPTKAPVQGGELMSILCRLAAPIAVLVHHPEPTAHWLERAISTAAALVAHLPDHAVAVGAPADLVSGVLGGDRQSAALSMARQGVVPIAPRAEGSAVRARSRAARVLHAALARDARTAGRFALDAPVPIHAGGSAIEVDLVAESARLAIEIDGWYHFRDPEGYRTARVTDLRLQRAGFFVMRFLAEDVGDRLALIVDEIAVALRGRRASTGSPGEFP